MLGEYLREQRELLKQGDKRYSLHQVSQRVDIEPTYLSKIEREELPPPSSRLLKAVSGFETGRGYIVGNGWEGIS